MIDWKQYHAFGDAIRFGDVAEFDRILQLNPEFVSEIDDAMPFLAQAARSGRAEFATKLLSAGANIEARDDITKSSALICGVRSGSIDTVKVLLDHGAKFNTEGHEHDPMFSAIMRGYVEIAKLLLDYGYDPNIEYGKSDDDPPYEPPWNALTFAIARGQTEIAEAIVTRSQHPIEGAADIIERTAAKFFPASEEEALDSKFASRKVDIQSMALFDQAHAEYPLLEVRRGEREAGLPVLLSLHVGEGPRECVIEPASQTKMLLSDLYRTKWPNTPQLQERAVQQTLSMLVESGYGFVRNAVDAYPNEDILFACRKLSESYASARK